MLREGILIGGGEVGLLIDGEGDVGLLRDGNCGVGLLIIGVAGLLVGGIVGLIRAGDCGVGLSIDIDGDIGEKMGLTGLIGIAGVGVGTLEGKGGGGLFPD